MGKVVVLSLPVPPSANHYYTYNHHIGKAGKLYRLRVAAEVRRLGVRVEGRLGVVITTHMPAKRDLDNVNKCLLDALQKARLYKNDNQIDDLRVVRGAVGDSVEVEVRELQ